MRKIQRIVEELAPPVIPPLAISPKDAADAIHMGLTNFLRLVNGGEIKVIRIGKKIIVPVESLREWLKGAA